VNYLFTSDFEDCTKPRKSEKPGCLFGIFVDVNWDRSHKWEITDIVEYTIGKFDWTVEGYCEYCGVRDRAVLSEAKMLKYGIAIPGKEKGA